jgi:hypothetical protein
MEAPAAAAVEPAMTAVAAPPQPPAEAATAPAQAAADEAGPSGSAPAGPSAVPPAPVDYDSLIKVGREEEEGWACTWLPARERPCMQVLHACMPMRRLTLAPLGVQEFFSDVKDVDRDNEVNRCEPGGWIRPGTGDEGMRSF